MRTAETYVVLDSIAGFHVYYTDGYVLNWELLSPAWPCGARSQMMLSAVTHNFGISRICHLHPSP